MRERRNQQQEEILKKLGLDFDNLTYWTSLSKIGIITMTSFIGVLLEFGVDTINLYFIGKDKNTIELAACGLGNAIGLFLFGAITGSLSIGIETLGSQAYGAQNFRLVGLWFNRGLIINILIGSILALLFCSRMDLILIYLGQDQVLAEAVGTYLRWSIPHIILCGIYYSNISYVQIQQKVTIYFLVDLVICPFHYLMAYLFISYFGLGLIGAALALDCSFFFGNFIFFIYINCSKEFTETLVSLFTKESLQEMGFYMRKAIAGLFLYAPRHWGLMSISILVSYVGNKELASNSILLNTLFLLTSLTYGSTISVSVLVGNAFGYPKLSALPLLIKAGFTISLGAGLLVNAALLLFDDYYVGLMTSDRKIHGQIISILFYVSLSSMLLQTTAVLEGLLRGSGEQKRAAPFNPFIYLILLPLLGYLLGFKTNLKLLGIWVGFDIAVGVVLLVYIIIVLNLDMQQILTKIHAREDYLIT